MLRRRIFCASLLLITMFLIAISAHAQTQTNTSNNQPSAKSSAPTQTNDLSLPVLGSGTAGQITKWKGASGASTLTVGDSSITEDQLGNLGIGIKLPTSKLTVQGMIESKLGGFKFPDGTVQTTAGVASLFHDASLMGKGSSSSPLGVAPGAITAAKIANGTAVRSLNGLFDNITLTAGPNITITPSGNTLTISGTGGGLSVVTHDNSYQHKQGYVKWKGVNGAQTSESHTDCSGLLNALFTQSFNLASDDFEKWFGKRRPLAIIYHDAIQQQRGFHKVHFVKDARPSDIIAIRYPPDSENSGHCLLIVETPQRRQPSKPEVAGTEQLEVTVIDSSRSGRHDRHPAQRRRHIRFGVGQGVFRLYTDREGKVVGYAWSTFSNSEYYDQNTRHLVVGQLNLPLRD